MSSLVRTMKPTAEEVDSAPLRSAASWKRPKFQNASKATTQPEEKRGAQSDVRRVLGEASSSSSESISCEQEPTPEMPSAPKPLPAARLKNHVHSPLAAVGQLVAERSKSLRMKGEAQEQERKAGANESTVSPPPAQDRQPVAGTEDADVSEKAAADEDKDRQHKSSVGTGAQTEVTQKVRSRSKADATAGIAALAAGLGGALPTQHGKKGKEQIHSRSPCPEETPSSETSSESSHKASSELTTAKKTSTHIPPVSPKPRRKQLVESVSSKLVAEQDTQPKIKTPTNSPVLTRRIPPKPSPRPSPQVSQSSSPALSPRSSPGPQRRVIRPLSPGRLNLADRKTSSVPGSPVLSPHSPKGSPPLRCKAKDASRGSSSKALNDADTISTGSVGDCSQLLEKKLSTESGHYSDNDSKVATPDVEKETQPLGEDVSEEENSQERHELLDFGTAVALPRLNTSAARFKSSLSAKGGLANRRKPTRQHVRQVLNAEQDKEEERNTNGGSEVSPSPETGSAKKSSVKSPLFKKAFSSVRVPRVTRAEKPSIGSSTFEQPKRAPSPTTPKAPADALTVDLPGSPRQRAQTVSPSQLRPLAPPMMLLDLQRSPLLTKRRHPNEMDGSGADDQLEQREENSDVVVSGQHPAMRRLESSGTLGSRATNSPSVGSADALQTDDSAGSKQSLELMSEDRPASRASRSSRFQVYTPFDWDVNDVAHWLSHKLKMEEMGDLFRENSVDGETLLALDVSKIKAMGVEHSKTISILKKEVKSLKSQAEKARKEERKRLEREAKLEKKRKEAAAKEAKRLEKSQK